MYKVPAFAPEPCEYWVHRRLIGARAITATATTTPPVSFAPTASNVSSMNAAIESGDEKHLNSTESAVLHSYSLQIMNRISNAKASADSYES